MSAALVSCVVPVFNGERYLRETLDTIVGQTWSPLEVIVADDGSTDGTREIAESAGARYVRQPNRGPAAARNLGLGVTEGEFVAFLDSDDLWHPEKLERQMARFRARPGLALCFTLAQNFLSPELDPGVAIDPRLLEPVAGYRSTTMLARRSLFDTLGRFDSELRHGGDTDWFLRATEQGAQVELLREVLVRRRLHDANRSTQLADNSRREFVHIVKAALDRRRAAD
jgi:glycosyltransferase involved in cell wall biosynthesis